MSDARKPIRRWIARASERAKRRVMANPVPSIEGYRGNPDKERSHE